MEDDRHNHSQEGGGGGFTSLTEEDEEESKGLLSDRNTGHAGPREGSHQEGPHYLKPSNARFKIERTNTNANNPIDDEARMTMDEYIESVGDVGWFQYFAFLSLFMLVQPIGFILYNVSYLIHSP